MTDVQSNEQAQRDFHYVQNLLENEDNVIDEAFPGRKDEVLAILDRCLQRGRRRGGPTKDQLIQLRNFAPGDFTVTQTSGKRDIIQEIIHNINVVGGNNEDRTTVDDTQVGIPTGRPGGPVPEGWEDLVPSSETSSSSGVKPLLLLSATITTTSS